ncbi:MAG: thioredoxin-dependent thiol peroxidase [Candidatus Omnitrophica bacterium]|nr:thioredoxin-dependent thiol peroxidase [Candidatus Omnitrophota bacterium]
MLTVGQKAPDFSVLTDNGKPVKLSDFRGKKVVLYFYPKDDTPGCTREACSFRDGAGELRKRGVVVLGVSADSVESHKKFKTKFRLNFLLLSDAQKQVVQAYGVWKEKSLYGRTYMGLERTTFLIDEAGRIAKVFPRVKVDGHFDEVLEALDPSTRAPAKAGGPLLRIALSERRESKGDQPAGSCCSCG